MNTYKGFLFGHYDSRGGCTFVEADDEADACKRYGTGFGEPVIPQPEWDAMIRDDLIGPAVIRADAAPEPLADLDGDFQGEMGKAWIRHPEFANYSEPGEADLPDVELYEIEYRTDGSRPAGCVIPRWDDDAYGLLFIPKGYDCCGKQE